MVYQGSPKPLLGVRFPPSLHFMPKLHTKTKKPSYIRVLWIAVAVVLVWRGAWGLMDLYIFPDHLLASYIISLALGLIVLFSTHKLSDLI